ncbi:phage major capsid protein [Candidatus Mycolicibacterium alkanivorans]|uniref:Phage major capsid protein n=1 Tax=Candidatus Mycolicibacterium alkanivorans TaxID=2954114 RepID=A0ABS9YVM7_9MYCO|nr:phage major capsid protein [Candidatus Mycolicibacterium alkanivorans]MCI4675295.1 phage major capsid protein [Candidatus Mycolicibacterium alkanivorans]
MAETTSTAPELLAEQVASLLVQPLEAASVVLSSGPRIFDTAGVLRVPKIAGSDPVNYVAEAGLIDSTHSTAFDEVVLMPTERKSIKVIERYTRELVRQSVVGIDSVLQNRLVKVVSDQLDQALLTGAGTDTSEQQVITVNGTPTGGTFTVSYRGVASGNIAFNAASSAVQTALQAVSTIGASNATVAGSAGGPYTVTFAGALANLNVPQMTADGALLTGGTDMSVTVTTTVHGEAGKGITGLTKQAGVQTGTLDVTNADSLLTAIGQAVAAEVTPNRWFISGADFIALRKLKEQTGSAKYLLESDVTSGPTYRMFGIGVTPTNKLPTGTAVLVDMSQVAVARDVAPSVTILTERYAEYDEIGIRVTTRYDLGVLQPAAVIVLTA